MGVENLLLGFQVAITPYNLFIAVVGIALGTIIGVLPGLGGANGVAILLPLTFTMPPTSAIILLTSIYWGALFGGAITSVLFNIPGEPWSVATTFDGYPLARQGRGGGDPLKSLVSILLGFILAAVGLDIVTGQLRMTFGLPDLMKGFDFIVAVIGLFGIGEIQLSLEEGLRFHGAQARMNMKVVLDT